jgi:hypothetical protein
MRIWYKYFLSNKILKNITNRFNFTDFQLINEHLNFKFMFNYKNFISNEIFYNQYKFLKKNLVSNKKEILFLGSSWGEAEYHLKNKFKVVASDINTEYIEYHNKNKTGLKFIKLDILNLKNFKKKYSQIVFNSFEYLLNKDQMDCALKNIYKISTLKAKIFVIFRSSDSFFIRLIDNILLPMETYFIYLIKKIINKKKIYYINKQHGFRRTKAEFIKEFNINKFKVIKYNPNLFLFDLKRLLISRTLLNFLLKKFFFNVCPYLNFFILKKIK